MKKFLLCFVLLFSFNALADDTVRKPGIYYCYTEKLVGIQPTEMPKSNLSAVEKKEWKKKNRIASKLNPIKEKFIIKIKTFNWDYVGKKLKPPFSGDAAKMLKCNSSSSITRIMMCLDKVKYIVELPMEKNGFSIEREPISTNGYTFFNDYTMFWLNGNLEYSLAIFRGIDGSYLEEGKCETFTEY